MRKYFISFAVAVLLGLVSASGVATTTAPAGASAADWQSQVKNWGG